MKFSMQEWSEFIKAGAVDITSNQEKLDFLKSRGLTVGTMQESGKSPYLMYVIEPGSELCDLEAVNKLVDAEIQRDKAIELLKRCYTAGHRQGWEDGESNTECFAAVNDFLSNTLGSEWGDKMEVADDATESECSELATKQIRLDTEGRDVTNLPGLWDEADTFVSDIESLPELTDDQRAKMNAMPVNLVEQLWNKETELDQPFTVDWLVEIGGRFEPNCLTFTDSEGGWFRYCVFTNQWSYRGVTCPHQPTTRRDVLKWLDVLGIEPTTKGGAT